MTDRSKGETFSSCSCTPPPAVRRSYLRQQKLGWNAPSDAVCHRTRPPPARRRNSSFKQPRSHVGAATRPWLTLQSLFFAVLFTVLFCSQGATAASIHGSKYHMARSEGIGELLIDTRAAPNPRARLGRRAESTSSLLSSTAAATSTESATSSTTGSSTIETAAPATSASLPMPFDTSLGNNFTSPSCPTFFHTFLDNSTFNDCLPFSLLLQTSSSFFSASKSLVRLTQTLDATCNVNFDQCSALMSSLAEEIQSNNNCGEDLQLQNPMVLQAYNGFLAYQPLYHAGCLTDTEGNYCFANAVTNASAPTSSYIYYLPLGVQLPGGTQPACNMCLQNTMSIFATAAGNSTQPLNGDYTSAAQMVDMTCGPTFVDASVARTSGASTSGPPGIIGLLTAVAMLFSALL